MQDLRKLSFEPEQSPGSARQLLVDAACSNLAELQQAEQIGEDRILDWAGATVESAMQRLAAAMQMAPPRADRSCWDDTKPEWWIVAARLVASECNALAQLLPSDLAALSILDQEGDPGNGLTARMLASRKLCLVPAAGLTDAGWRARLRCRWMRECWRGGSGFGCGGSWEPDDRAITAFARFNAVQPEEPWFPGLLRRRSGAGWSSLRLAGYIYPGAGHSGLLLGWIPESLRRELTLQVAMAHAAGLSARDAGFAIFDPVNLVWSWRKVEVDLSQTAEILQSGQEFWTRHVMTGVLPDPPPAAKELEVDDPKARRQLLECWAVSMLGSAVDAEEKKRRTALLDYVLELTSGDRRASLAVDELCALAVYPPDCSRAILKGLDEAGLDDVPFRKPGPRIDGEGLLAALKEAADDPGGIMDRIGRLVDAPPAEPGALDEAAAAAALRDAGVDPDRLLSPTIRITATRSAASRKLEEETALRLDELVGDVIELVEKAAPVGE